MIAKTPKTPYYAVIFTSLRTDLDNGYGEAADQMEVLAKKQKGYLGIESARGDVGITVSYWESLEAIRSWKNQFEHSLIRDKGREKWYQKFQVRICKVERDYGFEK